MQQFQKRFARCSGPTNQKIILEPSAFLSPLLFAINPWLMFSIHRSTAMCLCFEALIGPEMEEDKVSRCVHLWVV